MGVFHFILLCAVVGILVFLVTKFVPMPDQIKQVIIWGAVIILVLILLGALGLFQLDQPIPRITRP